MASVPIQQITLESLMQGGLNELFAVELQNVLQNILDPNTPAFKSPRKLNIELTFNPTEDRDMCLVDAVVRTKLQPNKPLITTLGLSRRGNVVVATEYSQASLFDQAYQD